MFFLDRRAKSKFLLAGFALAAAFSAMLPFSRGAGLLSFSPKSIPAITFENLSPPYTDYDYFQHGESVPFEYDAPTFSLVNAWWLAEVSTLVYADEDYVRSRFEQAGLERVLFFDASGTQCFIASNNRSAVIAFRGSEIWKRNKRFDPRQMFADLLADIDIRLSDWYQGGRVHNGFKSALDKVWTKMLPEINMLKARRVAIWVTGHSLGAALATLAADRLQNVQGLYTYGSPRVGDQEFHKRFAVKAYRVINGRDIVAELPFKGHYRHVGEPVFIDQRGGIHFNSPNASIDNSCPTVSNAIQIAGEVQKSDSALYIPAWIRDHVPVLYSIYLWNALVDNLASCVNE